MTQSTEARVHSQEWCRVTPGQECDWVLIKELLRLTSWSSKQLMIPVCLSLSPFLSRSLYDDISCLSKHCLLSVSVFCILFFVFFVNRSTHREEPYSRKLRLPSVICTSTWFRAQYLPLRWWSKGIRFGVPWERDDCILQMEGRCIIRTQRMNCSGQLPRLYPIFHAPMYSPLLHCTKIGLCYRLWWLRW